MYKKNIYIHCFLFIENDSLIKSFKQRVVFSVGRVSGLYSKSIARSQAGSHKASQATSPNTLSLYINSYCRAPCQHYQDCRRQDWSKLSIQYPSLLPILSPPSPSLHTNYSHINPPHFPFTSLFSLFQ